MVSLYRPGFVVISDDLFRSEDFELGATKEQENAMFVFLGLGYVLIQYFLLQFFHCKGRTSQGKAGELILVVRTLQGWWTDQPCNSPGTEPGFRVEC